MSLPCGLAQAILVASLLAAPAARSQTPQPDLIKRGEYLARAGDCFSCHTKQGGAALAGGRQVETPYGSIASPNLTPDKATGIGDWSDDDFYRLMHEGLDRKGGYIYPVMPFDHYTKVTRDDVLAIKAYLFSLPPVNSPRPKGTLHFPFNIRTSLAAWRTLFFKPGEFQPDPAHTAEQNRGAYLVEGLGHCGACHTPRNFLSGSKDSQALAGGEIAGQGWFAPNITANDRQGIGGWTEAELVSYLKTGIAKGRSDIVAGPMAEVVHTSLSFMTDPDLHAIAAYLKVATPKAPLKEQTPAAPPGAEAYLAHCASCHQLDGRGIEGAVPSLVHNGTVTAGGAQNLVRTILGGMNAHGNYGPMPGFATTLSGTEIAQIANYVRGSWSNAAPANATGAEAGTLAKTTLTMLAGTGPCDAVPQPVAAALASADLAARVKAIDAVNMVEQVDAILPKLKGAAPQEDVVNGLIAAYCPAAMADPSQPPGARVLTLQRFASVVYSRLSSEPAQPRK